jgi:hypothetical protein
MSLQCRSRRRDGGSRGWLAVDTRNSRTQLDYRSSNSGLDLHGSRAD